jgi:hypothetical protein
MFQFVELYSQLTAHHRCTMILRERCTSIDASVVRAGLHGTRPLPASWQKIHDLMAYARISHTVGIMTTVLKRANQLRGGDAKLRASHRGGGWATGRSPLVKLAYSRDPQSD